MVQTFNVTEPWVHSNCKLGEGPYHEESTGKLRFLDIEGKQILWLDPKKGPDSLEKKDTRDKIGFTSDIEGHDDSTIIVGAKYGFAFYSKSTNALSYIDEPSAYWTSESERAEGASKKAERMRFNDGRVDCRGRLWGSMINDPDVKEFTSEGALFCLDPKTYAVRRVMDGVTIGNGMGWSDDNKTLYFTDSPKRGIMAYDFDEATANLSNPRVLFDVRWTEKDDGDLPVPDGFAQDEEGGFWIALFGAGKVIRVVENKDTGKGEKVAEITLPTLKVTCPVFVGQELWITTARDEGEFDDENTTRYGGAVFKVDVGVKGKRVYKWPVKPTT